MITAIAMISDSLRLACIIDQIQSPPAEMGVAALRTLNQMVADWSVDGIQLGWYTVTDLDAVLPLEESDERAIKYNLAVELCGEYGIEPLNDVSRIRNETYARLAKSSADEVVSDLSSLPCESALINVAWPIG